MSFLGAWAGSECAVQVTSRLATAMMPGRSGAPAWHEQVELPADAVRPGLQGTNVDAAALSASLGQLGAAAPHRIGAVTLVLPDACTKLRVVPIETEEAPGSRAGAEIVRWAIRDALPFAEDEALIDTQMFDTGSPTRLLVAAAHRDVLREYEDALAVIGPVVRTLPATIAAAWSIDDDPDQHLLVHADHDALGCMVSGAGVPLFVRTRPLPRSEETLVDAVMETLDYAGERLGTEPGLATVAGLAADAAGLDDALIARGWALSRTSPDGVELGGRFAALSGALRAAEAGI